MLGRNQRKTVSWTPLNEEGVVIFSRAADGFYQISLNKNDKVRVLGECRDWYKVEYTYTRKDANGKNVSVVERGIYPAQYIRLASQEGKKDEKPEKSKKKINIKKTGTANEMMVLGEDTLAFEILQVIKEWATELNKLKKEKRRAEYNDVKRQMAVLVGLRKQFMDLGFQQEAEKQEKKALIDKVIRVIEEGSRKLNLDLIVRVTQGEKKGERASELNTGVIQLYQLYRSLQREEDEIKKRKQMIEEERAAMSKKRRRGRNIQQQQDAQPEQEFVKNLPKGKIQLLIDVQACLFTVGEPTELYISLYSKKKQCFISEEFMVELTDKGMPKDERLIANIKTLFKDMEPKDYLSDMYLVCKIYRLGKIILESNEKLARAKKSSQESGFRRPFGCAVVELTPQVISDHLMTDKEYGTGTLEIFNSTQESSFSNIHEMIIEKTGNYEKVASSKAIGVVLGITLYKGSYNQIAEETKKIKDVPITPLLDLPEVVEPGNMRNDLYLTLKQGTFNESKNIKVEMKVYLPSKPDGPQECLSRGNGLYSKLQKSYESSVLYNVHSPCWNEIVKISLPKEAISEAVVVFIFSNCSKRSKSEPFGIAFLKLTSNEGTIIPNTMHEVEVFKYIKDMETQIDKYLSSQTGLISIKSKFSVDIKLTSTLVTQDPQLHNLLNWKEKTEKGNEKLEQIVDRSAFIDAENISKYLREIFNALFTISEKYNDEKTTDLVYKAILHTVDSLSKKQFSKYKGVVVEYINTHFKFPMVHKWMLLCLDKYLVEDKTENPKNKMLSGSLLAFHYLIRFIVESRLQFEKQNPKIEDGKDGFFFMYKLREVMQRVNKILGMKGSHIIAAQDKSLKFIPSVFNHISKVFKPKELGQITRDFILSIPHTGRQNTIQGKMHVLNSIAHGYVVTNAESRKIILPTLIAQLQQHFNQSSDERKGCIQTLSNLLATLQGTTLQENEMKESIQEIMYCLPEITLALKDMKKRKDEMVQKLQNEKDDEEVEAKRKFKEALYEDEITRADLAACVLCLFYVLDSKSIKNYLSKQERRKTILNVTKSKEALLELFELPEMLIQDSPIPEYWISFNVFQYFVILKFLKSIAEYLRESYLGDNFDLEIWNKLINTTIQYIQSSRLALQNFTISKAQKLTASHGDLRVAAIKFLDETWKMLDDKQIHFIPAIVDPILRVANIPQHDVNVVALNIYYSILQREFKANKTLVQSERVTAVVLDEYIVNDKMDLRFKEFFVTILEERFNQDKEIKKEGTRFLNQTKHLMELITAVQKYKEEEEDAKTGALLHLMDYVNSIGSQELYFKYVDTLANTHVHNKNFVEAGMALLIHLNKLSFSSNKILPKLSTTFPEQEERLRKEMLYNKVIKYFDDGNDWERAIKLTQELAEYYLKHTYEYKKLAALLQKQGELYKKVAERRRLFASYFYVAFYGKGFKEYNLMGKEFIYKGYNAEHMTDFHERILKRFPNAELLKPLTEPSKEVIEGDGQYIQIITVYPSSMQEFETKCQPKERDPNILHNILSYNDANNVYVFKYTKTWRKNPHDKTINEYRDLYTTYYFLIVDEKEKFPGIVRRVEVKEKREFELGPVENAVKNIEDKNSEFQELIIAHRLEENPDTQKLSMMLNGVIDAAVMGGVQKYLDAFFDKSFVQQNKKEIPNLKRFQRALENQLVVLKEGLAVYRKHGKVSTRKHVEHLENLYIKMTEQLKEPIKLDFNSLLKE